MRHCIHGRFISSKSLYVHTYSQLELRRWLFIFRILLVLIQLCLLTKHESEILALGVTCFLKIFEKIEHVLFLTWRVSILNGALWLVGASSVKSQFRKVSSLIFEKGLTFCSLSFLSRWWCTRCNRGWCGRRMIFFFAPPEWGRYRSIEEFSKLTRKTSAFHPIFT